MIWFLLGIYEILPVFTTQLQYFFNYIQTVAVAQFYHNNNYLAHKTNKGPEKSRNIPLKISMVESCFDNITGQYY